MLSEMNRAVEKAYEAQEAFFNVVGKVNIERRTPLHKLDGGMYEGLISLADPCRNVPSDICVNGVVNHATLLQLMTEAFNKRR